MRPSGAHTHPDSGGGAAVAVLALFILVGAGGAIAAAAGDVLRVLALVACVTTGLAVTAAAGVVVWRIRHRDRPAPWTVTTLPARPATRMLVPPAAQRRAIGRGNDVHLHLHGLSPADIAAALARLNDGQAHDDINGRPW
jgi:hypothetical protein